MANSALDQKAEEDERLKAARERNFNKDSAIVIEHTLHPREFTNKLKELNLGLTELWNEGADSRTCYFEAPENRRDAAIKALEEKSIDLGIQQVRAYT